MKKFMNVVYAIMVLYLLLLSLLYFGIIIYDGLNSIKNYSLEGGNLLFTMMAIVIVIFKYPVTLWIQNTIKFIKADMRKRKHRQQTGKSSKVTIK